jgi:hypothetical protein
MEVEIDVERQVTKVVSQTKIDGSSNDPATREWDLELVGIVASGDTHS